MMKALKTFKESKGYFLDEAMAQYTVMDNREIRIVCVNVYILIFHFRLIVTKFVV